MRNKIKSFMLAFTILFVIAFGSVAVFSSTDEIVEPSEIATVPDEEGSEAGSTDEDAPDSGCDRDDDDDENDLTEDAGDDSEEFFDEIDLAGDANIYDVDGFESEERFRGLALASAVEDGEDEDEDTDDPDDTDITEEPDEPRDPEEIYGVNVITNTSVYSYRKPVYTATVAEGNVRVIYEGWTCEDGRENRSDGYCLGEDFTNFEDGLRYTYSICIKANDEDYFTENTVFRVNGTCVSGTFSAHNTVFVVTGLFEQQAYCSHGYETITIPASCTMDGRKYKKCRYCQNEITLQTFPAIGHAYELDEDLSYDATCTTNGAKVYVCGNCQNHRTESIPATGHRFVHDGEGSQEPTCTVDGYDSYVCTNDGCDSNYRIAKFATGHHMTLDEEKTKEPTCTVDGYEVYSCANDGCNYTERGNTLPATGHHFAHDKDESVAPTCEEAGYKLFVCTNEGCDESYTEPIAPTGHRYYYNQDESLAPTCETDGYKLYSCKNEDCEASYKIAVAKTGHHYVYDEDGSKDPTCTTAGYKKYSCVNEDCNASYKTAVNAIGHHYVYDEDSSKEPTCTVAGYKNFVCTNEDCNASYKTTIKALGHVYALKILKVATNKAEGTYCYACTRDDCEATQNKQTIFPYKTIKLSGTSFTYTGSAIKPTVKVVDTAGKTIDPSNYVVVYYDNKNVGTATVHITFSRMYNGTLKTTFKITQASQKITTTKDSYTVKYADVKKKAQSVSLGASAKTTLSYSSSDKNKNITVSSSGKVTIKKGTKKGTYKDVIVIKAKETKNYKAKTKKITIVVK